MSNNFINTTNNNFNEAGSLLFTKSNEAIRQHIKDWNNKLIIDKKRGRYEQ